MFKNNPLFFINFLFFQHTVFVFQKLCFAENTIKIVFSGKHSFSKTQLVKPTFSTMSKNTLDDHKKDYFYRVLGPYPFSFFFFFFFLFFCFYFSNIKRKNQKCKFLVETSFLINPKFCKNTILTHCGTICVSKNAKKHCKTWENSKNKLGPVFNL